MICHADQVPCSAAPTSNPHPEDPVSRTEGHPSEVNNPTTPGFAGRARLVDLVAIVVVAIVLLLLLATSLIFVGITKKIRRSKVYSGTSLIWTLSLPSD